MVGQGKGGKGVGKVGAKRLPERLTSQVLKVSPSLPSEDSQEGGGVKRISTYIYDDRELS